MSAVPAQALDSGRAAAGGVLAAACVSTFVVNANTSAVTILLPTMSEDTGAPVAQLQWAVTGYMLVGAAVIVTSGALGDVFGRRRVFLGGLALFLGLPLVVLVERSLAAGDGYGLDAYRALGRPTNVLLVAPWEAIVNSILYAGAALPAELWRRLEDLARRHTGRTVPMTSAWGSTETAPMATSAHFVGGGPGNIGVPVPGTTIKLVPSGTKQERNGDGSPASRHRSARGRFAHGSGPRVVRTGARR